VGGGEQAAFLLFSSRFSNGGAMPEEISELHERAEAGEHDSSLKPVTMTMAVLAVLVAIVSVAGHRTHTEELLLQNKTTDQWAYYQAKNMRQYGYQIAMDELSIFSLGDAEQAAKVKEKYAKEALRYAGEMKDIQAEARNMETEAGTLQRRGDRFDLGEVLLECALVITSITLLTRRRSFWFAGLVFGIAGLVMAASGFLLH
jgi:Domain of unknown function (DUF4337)